MDDLTLVGRPVAEVELPYASGPTSRWAGCGWARLAAYVRDRRNPLELCPSSNVQTGAAGTIAGHPVTLLSRLRSGRMKSAFLPYDLRRQLIRDVFVPG